MQFVTLRDTWNTVCVYLACGLLHTRYPVGALTKELYNLFRDYGFGFLYVLFCSNNLFFTFEAIDDKQLADQADKPRKKENFRLANVQVDVCKEYKYGIVARNCMLKSDRHREIAINLLVPLYFV